MHLHSLITDAAFEEAGADVRFLPAATPTQGRMTAVLAQVHKAVAAVAEDDDLDMDPALAACVQLALAGPHAVPPPEPAARPSLTVSAFDMHLRRRGVPTAVAHAAGLAGEGQRDDRDDRVGDLRVVLRVRVDEAGSDDVLDDRVDLHRVDAPQPDPERLDVLDPAEEHLARGSQDDVEARAHELAAAAE